MFDPTNGPDAMTHWAETTLLDMDPETHPETARLTEPDPTLRQPFAVERFYRLNRTSAIRAERDDETRD